jgi:hypothetical protein
VRRFKNETQEDDVASRSDVEDIITDECRSAMEQGVTNWTQIRGMIKQRMDSLSQEERLLAEHRLRLMIDADRERPHAIVRH